MEKAKDMGSEAKEHVKLSKIKVEEKAETGLLKNKHEKKIVHELSKAKEHQAKKETHEAKARHAAEKLNSHGICGVHRHRTPPVVAGGGPMAGNNPYPVGHQHGGTVPPAVGHTGPPYPAGAGGYPAGY